MALKPIILLTLAIASNSQIIPNPVCKLPIVTGPCRASIRSFGYNGKTGQCEAFIYGGCKGNKNRFASERACAKACETSLACTMDAKECPDGSFLSRDPLNNCEFPDCPLAAAAASSVFCPQDVKTCEDGSFVGRDSTKGCAFKPCPPCSLPKETGPCKAAFSRFYFNAESGACEQFTYGGCAGNGNNFETEKECQKTCDPSSLVCTLDVEECPDGSFVSRDPLNDCEFEECPIVPTPEPVFCTTDVKECSDGSFVSRNPDNDCAFDPCPPCSFKPEIGNCEALIPRFYYDASTGECESFKYGGCGGNENNFETEMECAVACKEPKACTKDAKLCPSGIALGRDPYNNCEFPDCICGGFENCRSYFDGCKKCKCNADGTETCVENDKLMRLCKNGNGRRKMESKCLRCNKGYSVNKDGKCEEDVVKPVDPVVCTQDVKECPDGSYVRRAGPNCEFRPCP